MATVFAEAAALGEAIGRHRKAPLPVGSAKTNIGHSESAAGVVGLIKVIQAMRNDVIPANINYSAPNRYIDFEAEHLEVVEDPREWPEYSGHKVAGVSGFGFGGTNAHVVLTDYRGTPAERAPQLSTETVALPVSGLLPSRRARAAALLADYIEAEKPALVDVARTVARRAEREAVALVETGAPINVEAVKYLNRLSDHLFVAARRANANGAGDVKWKPGATR